MRTCIAIAVVALLALSAQALTGINGYDGSLLFTVGDMQGAITYPSGYAGVEWQDLARLELWAPIPGGNGRRDGIACASNGDLYVLVMGRDSTDPEVTHYTGLIRFDGSAFHHVLQDEMDSGYYATREGSELKAVIVSPTSTGALTEGHPVLLRQTITGQGASRTYAAEIFSVDPATGDETFLHDVSDMESSIQIAIDGSGGAADGTIYVGPRADGSIHKLVWSASSGAYTRSTIPGSFAARSSIQVDGTGALYAFSDLTYWGTLSTPYDNHQIYEIDPDTGTATLYAEVDGHHFIFDWAWAHDGPMWLGVRKADTNARKIKRSVTAVLPNDVTSSANGISTSDRDAWCIAPGPDGEIYVLQNAFSLDGEVHVLTPGSGSSGGGKGNGKGK